MSTPINQLVPKVRKKLSTCVADIERYKDDILTIAIKSAIDMELFDGKKFNHNESVIDPAIAENSSVEQQVILKVCLLFGGKISPRMVDTLSAELHKAKNGKAFISGR